MSLGHTKYVPAISLMGDVCILNLIFVVYFVGTLNGNGIDSDYILFFIFLNASWLFLSYLLGALKSRVNTSITRKIGLTTRIFVFFIVVFLMFFQWNPDLVYVTKQQKQVQFSFFYMLLILWKLGLHYSYLLYRNWGITSRTMLIIGNTSEAKKLMEYINDSHWHGYRCPGIITIDDSEKGTHCIGNIREVDQLLNTYKVGELFISMEVIPLLQHNAIKDLITNLPVEIRLIPNLGHLNYFSMDILEYGPIPVLALHPGPLSNVGNQILKRTFDILFSLLVLVLILSWLIPVLWILDMLNKRNGVFFIQKRTSLYGKEFKIYKFRTMVPNEEANLRQAVEKDHRITPLGSFLRKTSIDELPQFINVLTGDMSVVGPRPHMIAHTESYRKIVNTFMQRHMVKPGITGLAQISGYRGEIRTPDDVARRVALDIDYIRTWTFGLDMLIILKTIFQVLRAR
jgi:putative colanic acid biosynthesis UDP-glucose lipid carrier transferase